jgi:hypothetical protein
MAEFLPVAGPPAPIPSFPRKRESIFCFSAKALFRLEGDLLSFACAKESKQRKHTPGRVAPPLRYGVPCWCSPTEGGCGTRPAARGSDSPRRKPPRPAALLGAALRGPKSLRSQNRRCAQTSGFDLRFPFGDAEKRSKWRRCRRGLSEPGQRPGEFRSRLRLRASQGSCFATCRETTVGTGAASLGTFLAVQESTSPTGETGSPTQLNFPARLRRVGPLSQGGKWIPAFAGMTNLSLRPITGPLPPGSR